MIEEFEEIHGRITTNFVGPYFNGEIELMFDPRDKTVRIDSSRQWLNKKDLKEFIKTLKQIKKDM
jgi:hypothetical protein